MARQVAATDTVGVEVVVQDRGATPALSRVERRFFQLQSRVSAVQRILASYNRAAVGTSAANDQMAGRMRKVSQTTALMHSRLGQVMNLVAGLGPAALAAAAAFYGLVKAVQALGRALATAVRDGMAFEKRIAEIMTISEKSEFPIRRIIDMTTNLAAQFGVGLEQGAKALYQAISAGAVTAADAQAVLNSAAKLSIGGLTEMSNAVDVVTASINAYALESLSATQIADSMFTTIRYGVTTGEQLSRNLGNVTTVAAEVGVTFQELNAAVATLTKRGIRTQKATIQLRQVLAQIIKPTSMAKDEAKRLGIEFDTLAVREKGLLRFLIDIQNNAKFTSSTFAKLFGNVRALSAVFGLTIDNGEELARQLQYQAGSAGAADRAFNIMDATTSQLVDRYGALKEAISASLGNAIAEHEGLKWVLQEVVKALTKLLDYTRSADFQETIHKWMQVLARFGSLAIEVALSVRTAFHRMTFYMFEDWGRLKAEAYNFWQDQKEAANDRMARFRTTPFKVNPKMEVEKGAVEGFLEDLQLAFDQAAGSELKFRPRFDFQADPGGGGNVSPLMTDKEALRQQRDEAARRAREEEKQAARRAAAAKAAAQWEREAAKDLREWAAMWDRIIRSQERGAELWERMNRNEAKAANKRALGAMVSGAKGSGDIGQMEATIERLQRMKAEVDAGLENLRTGILLAQDDLASAQTEEQAKDALQQVEEFVARYRDLVQEMNDIDRASDELKEEITRKNEQRTKRQLRAHERAQKAMAEVAKSLVSNMSAFGQELIDFEGNSRELTKMIAKRFVQMAGDLIGAMIRVAAVQKATDTQKVIGNAAVAGSAVGADAAGKFGIFATAIAPPLIALMVGMITSLLDKYHEGGMVGPNGQRIPLNLGPGEYAAVLRRGETVLPSARGGTGAPAASGPPVEVHYHGAFLTDPSRARFTRHMDEDVVPAIQESVAAGRASLSNQRLYGRKS